MGLSVERAEAALHALPGMGELLPALDGLPPCYLVGGAVRDLLLGATTVDLDVAVEGDAEAVALHLAERLGGSVRAHGRFGTATVHAGALRVDLAGTRTETYAAPGALPEVAPAPLADDLRRRDFTVNAMAMSLMHDDLGALHDPHGGRADLDGRLIRVLHAESFADDPTRILRSIRYAVRLGFALEPETESRLRAAVADGALATVSGPRIRDELLDMLGEDGAPDSVELARALGVGTALHPTLDLDPARLASAKLAVAETSADPVLTALAALCAGATQDLEPWLDRLGLTRDARDAVLRAASRAPALTRELRAELRPSAVYELLSPEPPETLALALALGAPAEPVMAFASSLRDVRLEITGADLLAAGVPESPALGTALERTLALKLDGEVAGPADELATALRIAKEIA